MVEMNVILHYKLFHQMFLQNSTSVARFIVSLEKEQHFFERRKIYIVY